MNARHLKKLMLLGGTVLGLSLLVLPAGAQVNVQIQLPPLIVFSSPPEMVILPDTEVYVVPDTEEEIFFFDGFWWRPWQGHWYRSQYYDRGWGYYSSEPSFYRGVPQGWRHDYQNHQWRGQAWQPERMHHDQVEKNWNTWKKDKYWEKHPQVQRSQPEARQPQAQKQQPQQPKKSQVNHSQGNQGQGQGNKSQGKGNKAAKQQGDNKNKQDKGNEKH